jgi:hypothetical protein
VADPRRLLAATAGAAAALAVFCGVALAARVEVGRRADHAELRLALRATGARLELFRERSDAELARLPAHLRQRRVREDLAIDYRLTVEIDGVRRLERLLAHRGVRRTRPLTLDEALVVAPGRRLVEVAFVPIRPPSEGWEENDDGGDDDSDDDEDAADPRLARAFAALPAPQLEEEIDFLPGRAEVVVLGPSGLLERLQRR